MFRQLACYNYHVNLNPKLFNVITYKSTYANSLLRSLIRKKSWDWHEFGLFLEVYWQELKDELLDYRTF